MRRVLQIVSGWLAVACLAATISPAFAQAPAYPAKPVRLIVPFPPGGSLDIAGRLIAQKLTEIWGQTVVVENKPGAGGNIGADYVAKSPPDGYTIAITSAGALATWASSIPESRPRSSSSACFTDA